MENKPHVAFLASPGLSHLVPIFELSKRLLTLHGFDVTVFAITTASSPAQSNHFELSHPNLKIISLLAPVVTHMLSPTDSIFTEILMMIRGTLPVFRATISSLAPPDRPSILIVDFFTAEVLAIADEFNMRKYAFIPCSAWFVALTMHLPTLDEDVKGELVTPNKPISIPGCRAVRFEQALCPLLDRSSREYHEYVQLATALSTADGILMNTWHDQEPKTIEASRGDKIWGRLKKVPVHPIGPVILSGGPSNMNSMVSNWLDSQRAESVIFVSFGCGGALSSQQMTELAWGLELSSQKFIWVVRPPTDNSITDYFTGGSGHGKGTPGYLPEGFCSRTRGTGLIIPTWAPQQEILGHPAIGGFITHCGWNSALESIVHGVPMIAWPLYAEQPMNAELLADELGVALRISALPGEALVRREEVERLVRKLLQEGGEQVRARVGELRRSAVEALSKGGTSFDSISKVAEDCKKWAHDIAMCGMCGSEQ